MNEWRSVALFVFSFIATSALLIMTDYGFLQSPSHSDQLDDPRILTQYEFADNTFLNYRTDDDQGLKVVVTIRKGTMERFLNQAISLMRFPNVSIAAICEDPEDSIFLKRAGFPVIYDTISIQTARFYVRRTDCTTGDQATQVRQAGLVMTKIQYYKKLLNQRRSFFATDAATVWTKSPSTIIAGRQSVHGLVLGIDTDVQKGPDHNLMQVVKSARPVRFAFFRAGRAVRRETFPKLYAFSLLNLCSYSTAENMILAELAIENLRWSYNEKAHFLYSKTPNMTVSSFSGDIYFNGCEQRASRTLGHVGVIRPACLSGSEDAVDFLRSRRLWFLSADWDKKPLANNWREYLQSITAQRPPSQRHYRKPHIPREKTHILS